MPVDTHCLECHTPIPVPIGMMIDCLLEDRELGYDPSPFVCESCLDDADKWDVA